MKEQKWREEIDGKVGTRSGSSTRNEAKKEVKEWTWKERKEEES